MIWRCKSRRRPDQSECEHECRVRCPFEPRGCLFAPAWRIWEEISPGDDEVDHRKRGGDG